MMSRTTESIIFATNELPMVEDTITSGGITAHFLDERSPRDDHRCNPHF